MERLVEKVVLPIFGEMYIANADEASLEATQALQKVFNKLYEYEEAEEQGLLVRLPCGVGDTVYVIAECGHVNKKLDGTLYDWNGGYGTATGYYCPYEDCCPHNRDEFTCCEYYTEKEAIFEDVVSSICIEETGLIVTTENLEVCGIVGEGYIFLTHEEAEQKLKEIEEGC